MKQGGNQALRDFFETYDLNGKDIKVKYATQAALFYRKQLAAKAAGIDFSEEAPQFEEGRLGLDGNSIAQLTKKEDGAEAKEENTEDQTFKVEEEKVQEESKNDVDELIENMSQGVRNSVKNVQEFAEKH